jgi:hypothetical protein
MVDLGCRGRRGRAAPGGTITTIAGNGYPEFAGDGGPATAASLQYRTGVAIDHEGNVFIAVPRTTASGGSIRTARSPPSRAPAAPASRATAAGHRGKAAQADRRGREPQG